MATQTVAAEIFAELDDLPLEQQREVLAFARSLKFQPRGVQGSSLLSFAGSISPSELTQMQEAIEEGCERIDLDEW